MFFLSYGQQTLNWLPHRLLKRQTVLLRTTITRTIMLHLRMKWLLGSNSSLIETCSQFRQKTSNQQFIFRPLNKTGWLWSSSCNNVGGNKCRLSTICAVFSIRVKVSGKVAPTISNKYYQGALAIAIKTFLLIFSGIALKLENVGPTFSSFNPHTSLPFVETDDRKQFQCLNIVFNNKTAPILIFWIKLMRRQVLSF